MIKVERVKGMVLIELETRVDTVIDHAKGEHKSFAYLTPAEASQLYYQIQWVLMDEELRKMK